MEFEVAFNSIYIMHYDGLVIFLTFKKTINMVHELNY
jgi:hypothetical protein